MVPSYRYTLKFRTLVGLGAGFLLGCLIVFTPLAVHGALANTDCTLFAPHEEPPSGTARAWSTRTGERLIDVSCEGGVATITVGTQEDVVSYEHIFLYRESYEQVGIEGQRMGAWVSGQGVAQVPVSDTRTYVLAYVCERSGAWDCGGGWRIQAFKGGTYSLHDPVALLKTSEGDIAFRLYQSLMPETTRNFVSLVRDDFYDGIKFHHVEQDHFIQTGDPLTRDDAAMNAWGTGGPGYFIEDEFVDHEALSNELGTVAMANIPILPDSGGSQFFINLADNTQNDHGGTSEFGNPVFGRVVWGMDTVQSISTQPTIDDTKIPQYAITIEDVVLLI